MISRALVASALGGLLIVILPGFFQTLCAGPSRTVSPEIINRYQQVLATDQDNLTIHYLLGVALLQDNQNEAALAKLQVAYPAYQQSIEAHYNLAIAALRLGDLVSTEIYLDQAETLGALETSELYPIAGLYFNMALRAQETGDANEAIRYFHKALLLDPQQIEVYRQLGDLYAGLNDTEMAMQSFRKYLHHFPDDPLSRDYLFALEFNRAQDLLATGDLNKAEQGFSTAIGIQPGSPAALYYLGYIAYSRNQPEQAVAHLNNAFPSAEDEVRQSIRPLLYNTAISLRKKGKLESSLDAITLLANQEQALFNELFLAGTINLELRKHRKAQTYLQRAVTLKPQDQSAQQSLFAAELGAFNEWLTEARDKVQTEDFAGAEKALQMANELQPQNRRVISLKEQLEKARDVKAYGHILSAQKALDSGEFSEAAEQIAIGLNIQPGDSRAQALRKEIHMAIAVDLENLLADADRHLEAGDYDRASAGYNQVLTIAPEQRAAKEGLNQVAHTRQEKTLTLVKEGNTALDNGQADQALKAFKQALAMDDDSVAAREGLNSAQEMKANRLEEYLLKGRQALGRNLYKEARNWFNQALFIDEKSRAKEELVRLEQLVLQKADDLAAQADQARRNGKLEQARKLYVQALTLVPTHKPSLTGQDQVAMDIETKAKEQLHQAESALEQLDYTTATTAYRVILDLDPRNAKALKGLQTSRDLQAENIDKLVKQSQEALSAGNWSVAERYLSEALRRDAYHKKAQQLRQRIEQVRQSGAQPGDEQQVYLQGVAYYTQGQYAQAIKAWETVLLLNPEHEKSIQNINKTRRKMSQIEEYRGS
jgi:tetratricopeptide (TPR) repeat protein